LPVSVVPSRVIDRDWTDPNGVKSHALYVVQVIYDSLPRASAVISEITTRLGRSSKSVCK
jgi:hypothetical protein